MMGRAGSVDDQCERRCFLVEELLRVATGRVPRSSIDDVLRRIVYDSTFFAARNEPLCENDVAKLIAALWSVLTNKGQYDPIGIEGDIPVVTGTSSRFAFVKLYASDLALETVVPDGSFSFAAPVLQPTDEEISLAFEQYLVSVLLLYSVDAPGEPVLMERIVPTLRDFFKAMGSRTDSGAVCEQLLYAMSELV